MGIRGTAAEGMDLVRDDSVCERCRLRDGRGTSLEDEEPKGIFGGSPVTQGRGALRPPGTDRGVAPTAT